jgi:uncharacterized SAM-binding protein YcdF (DUF218 family)
MFSRFHDFTRGNQKVHKRTVVWCYHLMPNQMFTLMFWDRLTRGLGAAAVIGFVISAYSPLWNKVGLALSDRIAPQSSDAIVVLAAALRRDGTLNDESLRRALHGIGLYRRGLAPLLVLSGSGGQNPPTISEAEVRAELARSMGIPNERIVIEKTANTTHEESVIIAGLLQPHKAASILLVTDSFHMRRSRLVFERAGFRVLPAPSDEDPTIMESPTTRLWLMTRVLQETFGLAYYRFAGYL